VALRDRLLAAYLAILLALLLSTGAYLANKAVQREEVALEALLIAEGQDLAIVAQGSPGATPVFADLARHTAQRGLRILLLRPDGSVAHAVPDATLPGPLASPEVQDALAGGTGRSTRVEGGRRRLFIAVPVRSSGVLTGAVRLESAPVDAATVVWKTAMPLAFAGLLAAVIGSTIIWFNVARLGRSHRAIGGVVTAIGEGRLSERVERGVIVDTAPLAAAINHMAQNVEGRVVRSVEERDTLSAVIHTMADALLVTDNAGMVTMVNAAASRLFRQEPDEMLGRRFVEAVRDHDIVRIFQRARDLGRPQFGQVEGAGGRSLRVAAAPIDQDGGASPVLVMVQDLTDMQRLQDMRREFVANVSHELRTPLASIKASVEALQAGAIDDRPMAEDFLRRMNIEVDALTDTVQRLMELSRVETGQAMFTLAPLRLKPVVDAVADRLRPQIDRHSLILLNEVSPELPTVMADVNAVSEVLINLLGNAIKYTPEGGKVWVRATAANGTVEVQVADTGQGIAAQHLPHIFERFYKADRSRASDGVGLGLALVKHLVQAHGGKVWAESVEGRGSTFSFTLPGA
jgi:two-component system phosphate regulon sensor histidine kinase PhoR